MNPEGSSEGFRPDPTYRLDPEVEARVPPFYDAEALRYLLSGLPEETRALMLERFFTWPGAGQTSLPRFGGPGMEDPAFAEALRALFLPLHRMRPELAEEYPFRVPSPEPES